MDINMNKVIFYIPKVVKNITNARSFHPQPIELKTYNKDGSICLVSTVAEYIKATEKNRKSKNLLSVTINTILSLYKLFQGTWSKHSKQQEYFIVYSPLYKTFQFIKDIHERAVLDRYFEKRRVEININI